MSDAPGAPIAGDEAVTPAFQPPPGNPRFALSDALRGLAVLTVVWAHAEGVAGAQSNHGFGAIVVKANIAVHVFFALSGFLLYRPFVTARAAGRELPSLREYARRRLLRIVPGYWVALTVLAVVLTVPLALSSHWWRYYTFTWIYSGNTAVAGSGDGPTWSLAIEMRCYLLMGLFAWAVRAAPAGRKWWRNEVVGLVLAFAVAVFGTAAPHAGIHTIGVLGSGFPWFVEAFLMGMALAVWSVWIERTRSNPGIIKLVRRHPGLFWLAGAGTWVLAALGFRHLLGGSDILAQYRHLATRDWLSDWSLTLVAAFCFTFPALFGDRAGGLPRRILSTRALVWIGVISYGMYLYHYPIEVELAGRLLGHGHVLLGNHVLTVLVPGLVLTVLAGTASYYLVELPFLKRKYRKTPASEPPLIAVAETPAGSH
ncbi:MAG: acyltransferase family protein [Solirubrobacteraceae bacterium]